MQPDHEDVVCRDGVRHDSLHVEWKLREGIRVARREFVASRDELVYPTHLARA